MKALLTFVVPGWVGLAIVKLVERMGGIYDTPALFWAFWAICGLGIALTIRRARSNTA